MARVRGMHPDQTLRGMLGGLRRGRGLPGRALVLQEAGGGSVAGPGMRDGRAGGHPRR